MSLNKAWLVAILGLVLSLVGIALIQSWGGVDELQSTTSPSDFAADRACVA